MVLEGKGKDLPAASGQPMRASIQSAIATIITVSVRGTKPDGTFDEPPNAGACEFTPVDVDRLGHRSRVDAADLAP